MDNVIGVMINLFLALVMVMACATLAIRPKAPASLGVTQGEEKAVVEWVFGFLCVVLVALNLNLWFPAEKIVLSLLAIAAIATVRAMLFLRGYRTLLLRSACCLVVAVLLCAAFVAYRVDASNYWLVETSNHDTLYYFSGARWALHEPTYASPELVMEKLGLGTCRQGAVFIGTDCLLYRSGTYTLLALSSYFGGGITANDMVVSTSLSAAFILVGLTPALLALRRHVQGAGGAAKVAFSVFTATTVALVFLSPAISTAMVNSNIATVVGSAAVCMTLGLAYSESNKAWALRSAMLGLSAAVAAHSYGEAAFPAVVFAATGVFTFAARERSFKLFLFGGLICAAAFLLSSNVVLSELVQSAQAINGIGVGGQWEATYLHATPLRWIAAPFSAYVVNGNPMVTKWMLYVGAIQAVLLLVVGSLSPRLRVLLFAAASLCLLMISMVEVRDYAYGEHKVIQLVGPPCVMLFVLAMMELVKLGGQRFSVRALALSMGALLIGGIAAQTIPTLKVVEEWKGPHGLSLGFGANVPEMAPNDGVVLDDAAAAGVERFQKSHYLAYLVQERGASALFPALDSDGMRGGYARIPKGDTLNKAVEARWLIQLRSMQGVASPFVYNSSAVRRYDEYDVVDMRIAPTLLAVSGENWGSCQADGCTVHPGFQIESLAWDGCKFPVLTVRAIQPVPPEWSTVLVRQDNGVERSIAFDGNLLRVPSSLGWRRFSLVPASGSGTHDLRIGSVLIGCNSSLQDDE